MTFDRSDLLVDISNRELTPLTEKLVEAGDPEPIDNTITEQQARMERYIHLYAVPDDWQKNWLRALVIWRLYQRIASIPDKRQKSYDDAMKELREVRDGKFKGIPFKDPEPDDVSAGHGRSGSSAKINTSRSGCS